MCDAIQENFLLSFEVKKYQVRNLARKYLFCDAVKMHKKLTRAFFDSKSWTNCKKVSTLKFLWELFVPVFHSCRCRCFCCCCCCCWCRRHCCCSYCFCCQLKIKDSLFKMTRFFWKSKTDLFNWSQKATTTTTTTTTTMMLRHWSRLHFSSSKLLWMAANF